MGKKFVVTVLMLIVALGAAWLYIGEKTIEISLQVGKKIQLKRSSITDALKLTDVVSISGAIELGDGRYQLQGSPELLLSLEDNTTIEIEANFSPRIVDSGDSEFVILKPEYIAVELRANHPINVISGEYGLTLSSDGLSLKSAGDDVVATAAIDLQNSLAQTLLAAVFAGHETSTVGATHPSLKETLLSASVSHLSIKLRDGAQHQQSTTAFTIVGDENVIALSDVEYKSDTGSLAGTVNASLSVSADSPFCVRENAPIVCAKAFEISINGEYDDSSFSRKILVDRNLGHTGAFFSISEGMFRDEEKSRKGNINGMELEISKLEHRYDKKNESTHLTYEALAKLDLTEGEVNTSLGRLVFKSASARDVVVVRSTDTATIVKAPSVVFRETNISRHSGKSTIQLKARKMRLDNARGKFVTDGRPGLLGSLVLTDLSAIYSSKKLRLDLNSASNPSIDIGGNHDLTIMADDSETSSLPLIVAARWGGVVVRKLDGSGERTLFTVSDIGAELRIESFAPPQGSVELGLEASAKTDRSGLSKAVLELKDALLSFDGDAYDMKISKGSIRIPKKELFNAARTLIPSQQAFDSKSVGNDLIKAGAIFINPDNWKDFGRLHDWRAEPWVSGINVSEIKMDGNQLSVSGRLNAGVNITANKEHIKGTTCEKRVKFKLGFKVSVKVKHVPCVKTSWSRIKVDTIGAPIDFRLPIEITSNAPTNLDLLKLNLRPTCNPDNINVRGVQNDFEKLLTRKLCEKMNRKSFDFTIGKRAAKELDRRYKASAQVEELDIRADENEVAVEFSLKADKQ